MLDVVASYHRIQYEEKRMIQTKTNGGKHHFGPLGPNSGHQTFFLKIWLHQSLDIMVNYHVQTTSEKTNDPILRKLSNGRPGRRTDGQTDENNLIGRCLTNVERPTLFTDLIQSYYFHLQSFQRI